MEYKKVVLIKYSEIVLKGLNRSRFEAELVANLHKAARADVGISYAQAAIYVEPGNVDTAVLAERFARVFGVSSVAVANVCEKDMAEITRCAVEVMKGVSGSFKAETKRADKRFPLTSPEISAQVGGAVAELCPGITVDVNNPDVTLNIEVRDHHAYVYTDKVKGPGGMPVGSGGRGLLMLSGGIDSPVAGYMMAKRGVRIEAVHYFSYPYTSERAKDKVIRLAEILTRYCGPIRLHLVPFAETQIAIRDNCPEEHTTLLMRRIMMYIADIVAVRNGCSAIITGESLGQVASQTIEAIAVVNSVAKAPVLRPLIGMNKDEIVDISRSIDTFDTSILPYEDCCTVFTPRHPTLKPKLDRIILSEKRLNVDELVTNAVKGIETVVI